MGGGANGDRIAASPEIIEALGNKIYDQVGAHIERAGKRVPKFREISYSNFTTVVWSMAMAYNQAAEFAEEELGHKWDQLGEIKHGLRGNAAGHQAADDKSTYKPR